MMPKAWPWRRLPIEKRLTSWLSWSTETNVSMRLLSRTSRVGLAFLLPGTKGVSMVPS